MNANLESLISDLPEIYQTIFGHEKWNDASSRDCSIRLAIITEQYQKLEKSLQRPLRVLDLGCAQGFFSLSLAKLGATVRGIDFLPANILVCQALADENPDLDVTFEVGRIEEVIKSLTENDYDMVIGLSVFHHIVHEHGLAQVKQWIKRLADCTVILIMELALREEPLYWGASLPENPAELIDLCAFYRQIGEFETHLSHINRPMYLISNKIVILDSFISAFDSWRNTPHSATDGHPHEGTRRYYFGESFVCKFFTFQQIGNKDTYQSQRNREELTREVQFLNDPPEGFNVPTLIESKTSKYDSWLVMERIHGELVSSLLDKKQAINIDNLLTDLLSQLVVLEKAGLYHDDIRLWNIIYDQDNKCFSLIDYGSISSVKQDCGWPFNIFLSFFVFVNELLSKVSDKKVIWRKGYINPFLLPEPYNHWLSALWQESADNWSFSLIKQLFEEKNNLPANYTKFSGMENWIVAQEKLSFFLQDEEITNRKNIVHLNNVVASLTTMLNNIQITLNDQIKINESSLLKLQQDVESGKVGNEGMASELELLTDEVCKLDIGTNEINSTVENSRLEVDKSFADIAQLNAKVDGLVETIRHLEAENIKTNAQNQAILNSRSWMITKPYRYFGLQIKLLRQYGFKQRIKHLVKRIIIILTAFLQRHPSYKNKVVTVLHKTGLYRIAYKYYRRVFPHVVYQSTEQDINDAKIDTQLRSLDAVPDEVKEIYKMITKDK
ncbi:methyltransferase domain-containing protein [Escherichia coli]|nr:methyltransferase domain-containing protein [Escherichia coli]